MCSCSHTGSLECSNNFCIQGDVKSIQGVFLRQFIPVVFSVLLIVVFWLSTVEYLWALNTKFFNCYICLKAEGNHLQDFFKWGEKEPNTHILSAIIEPISRQIGIPVITLLSVVLQNSLSDESCGFSNKIMFLYVLYVVLFTAVHHFTCETV